MAVQQLLNYAVNLPETTVMREYLVAQYGPKATLSNIIDDANNHCRRNGIRNIAPKIITLTENRKVPLELMETDSLTQFFYLHLISQMPLDLLHIPAAINTNRYPVHPEAFDWWKVNITKNKGLIEQIKQNVNAAKDIVEGKKTKGNEGMLNDKMEDVDSAPEAKRMKLNQH